MLNFGPVQVGVDPAANASDLDLAVDDCPRRNTLYLDDIGPTLGERGDALVARGVRCRLHRDDAAYRLAHDQRFADEQVHMGLQEAACAKLNDRERHGSDLDQRFDHAGFRLDPIRKERRRLFERRAMSGERSCRHQSVAHGLEDGDEVFAGCIAASEQ